MKILRKIFRIKTQQEKDEEMAMAYERNRVKCCSKCGRSYVMSHNSCPKDAYEKRKKEQKERISPKYHHCPESSTGNRLIRVDETGTCFRCKEKIPSEELVLPEN